MKVETKTTLKLTKEEVNKLNYASEILRSISDEMLESSDIRGYDYTDIEETIEMLQTLVEEGYPNASQ